MFEFILGYFSGLFISFMAVLVFNRLPNVHSADYVIDWDVMLPFIVLSWISLFFIFIRAFYFVMEWYYPTLLKKLRDFVEGN